MLQEVAVTLAVFLLIAAAAAACLFLRHTGRLPRFRMLLAYGTAGCTCLLLITMSALSGMGYSDWESARQADWAVVLGCQVNGEEPSLTLQERLNLCLTLMEENPEIRVVVSGSRGGNEGIEEGNAMYRWLEDHGADMSRVYAETAAYNTRLNLLYSSEIISEEGGIQKGLVIVTSDFHISRAKWLAANMGLHATGITCTTRPWTLRCCDLCRESLAMGKAVLLQLLSG